MMEEKIVVCSNCGCVIEGEVNEVDGNFYCEDCFNEEYFYCDECGELELRQDGYWVELEDIMICDSCCFNYFSTCDCCGELIRNDELERAYDRYGDRVYACERCLDDEFYYCEECGRYVHMNNYNSDEEMCNDCAEELCGIDDYHDNKAVHDRVRYGDDDLIGVELEVEGNHSTSRNTMAGILNDLVNKDKHRPHLVFEKDGSLDGETGFEIITTPHSLDEFYNLPWQKILDKLIDNGFTSHDNGNCGLHLHFNRDWFGEIDCTSWETREKSARKRNACIAKVVTFYEKCYDDLRKLSRRTAGQANEWAKPYGCNSPTATDWKLGKHIVDEYHSRYYAVNLTNSNTVEFRLGRGTLKYESFIAWIDFHATICKNARRITGYEVDHNNFDLWFDGLKPETVEYMKSRGAFLDFVDRYEKKVAVA